MVEVTLTEVSGFVERGNGGFMGNVQYIADRLLYSFYGLVGSVACLRTSDPSLPPVLYFGNTSLVRDRLRWAMLLSRWLCFR